MRLLVVDDHILFREGLIGLIQGQPDLEVVGQAGTGSEAVTKALELKPDLVLMDIGLPDQSGLDALRNILTQRPETTVVMLTIHESDDLLFTAIRDGAKGYILKNTPPPDLIASLKAVGKDEAALSRRMTRRLLNEFSRLGKLHDYEGADFGSLSYRELEVLKLLGNGLSNRQIGDRLVIAENTVKNHVHNILRKLDLHNRKEAAEFARRTGGLAPTPSKNSLPKD